MRKPKRIKKPRRQHARIIDTLTGPLERRVLGWLAARLPLWITPDILTGISFLAALIIAASYILSRQAPIFLWVACAGFILNWFGDSLDGTLARYRHIERPRYGYFIDHSMDAINETLMFFGVGLSPYVRFEIAAVALAGYLLLSIYATLSAYASSEFKISYAYLGPTEIRLIAILASIWVYFNGTPFIKTPLGSLTFLELMLIGLIVLFYAAFLFSTIGLGLRLAREDKPKNVDLSEQNPKE